MLAILQRQFYVKTLSINQFKTFINPLAVGIHQIKVKKRTPQYKYHFFH